jgi:hypothetical protein
MKDKIFPFLSLVVSCAYASEKPNLIVIQTDEHTINTLGCYRRLVGDINDSPWGKNVVQTPNIDRLAKEGAICTRYYASSPVSTPSRASFQTGLYPVSTGCPINDTAIRLHTLENGIWAVFPILVVHILNQDTTSDIWIVLICSMMVTGNILKL